MSDNFQVAVDTWEYYRSLFEEETAADRQERLQKNLDKLPVFDLPLGAEAMQEACLVYRERAFLLWHLLLSEHHVCAVSP